MNEPAEQTSRRFPIAHFAFSKATFGSPVFDLGKKATCETQRQVEVFHIEDDPLWADVTACVLREWPEVRYVGTASSGEEGVAQCRIVRPAIVLLDLVLPDMSGFEVWDLLNGMRWPPKILVMTCRADEVLLHRLVIGAPAGLIWKAGDFAAQLRLGIATVAAGNSYFPTEVKEAVRQFRTSSDAFHKILSLRELKLVEMLSRGQKDGDIANESGCARGTIRNHWYNIAQKLGLSDRHAVRSWAEQKGFGLKPASRPSAEKGGDGVKL